MRFFVSLFLLSPSSTITASTKPTFKKERNKEKEKKKRHPSTFQDLQRICIKTGFAILPHNLPPDYKTKSRNSAKCVENWRISLENFLKHQRLLLTPFPKGQEVGIGFSLISSPVRWPSKQNLFGEFDVWFFKFRGTVH